MKFDIENSFEKGTREFEELTGETVPAGYYSWVVDFITKAIRAEQLKLLQKIIKDNTDQGTINLVRTDGVVRSVLTKINSLKGKKVYDYYK